MKEANAGGSTLICAKIASSSDRKLVLHNVIPLVEFIYSAVFYPILDLEWFVMVL